MRELSKLPDGWRVVRLEDVAHVNPRRPKLKVPADLPTSFIPMAAVRENCQGITAYDTRPYHEIAKGYTYFESNDVLFAKITPCLQNGKHALAAELANGFGFGTTEFHVVRPGVKLDPKHLYRVLTQPRNILKCINSFTGTAGQQRVQPEVLRSLIVLLPPISEQRAIAAVLDAIYETIERTEAVISATERLRDALLHELLTRGIPELHTSWSQVPSLGTVPSNWHVARLIDVFEILDSRRVPLNADERAKIPGSYPYYGANGVVDYINDWIFDEHEDLILLAEDGGHFDEFNTRPIAYRVKGKCWVNNHAHILKAQDSESASFLFHSLVNKDIRPFINGTTRSKLTQGDLGKILIGIPSTTAEFTAIGNILDAIEALLIRLMSQIAALRQTELSTSSGLLSGSVRIVKDGALTHADA